MWHRLPAIISALAGLILWSGSAFAESRAALVIGNSNYEVAKALPNPANDAKAIAQVLNNAGFEVVMAFDLNRELMRQVIAEFSARVAEKGGDTVALVYYAGHGVQVEGDNFLVPVDARFEKESDVGEQGVRLADLVATLQTAPSKIRIFVLDACRNNPFSALNEVAGKGLAIVDAPSGSIVAYSTAPGAEASDGSGAFSPYAAAFMRTIKTPNLPIEQFFKKVRVLVNDSTGARQTPWESTSLTSDFVFLTNANADAAANAPPAKVAVADLRTRSPGDAYEVVVAEDSVEYYEEFVRLYPTDPLCDHIRRALSRRLQMVEWHKATKGNSAADYAAFLSKHGNGEFAKAAKKLQERPRLVALPSPLKSGGNLGQVKQTIPFGGRPVGAPSGSGGASSGPIVSKPGGVPIVSKPGGNVITPVTTTTVTPGGSGVVKTDSKGAVVKQTDPATSPVLKKGKVTPKVLTKAVQPKLVVKRQTNTSVNNNFRRSGSGSGNSR